MEELNNLINLAGEIRQSQNGKINESVASQSFGMALLGFLTTPESLDKNKVISLALIHELKHLNSIQSPLLDNLINEYKEEKTAESQYVNFLKQAVKSFQPNSTYTKTNNYINEYGNNIKVLLEDVNQLKRSGWLNRQVTNPESVAEHSYSVALSALILAPKDMDRNKLIKMALIHDIQEIYAGDFTPYDNITLQEKAGLELSAAQKIAKDLNTPEMLSLFMEYEQGESKEAKFIKDLDRMDAVILAQYYDNNKRAPQLLTPEFLAYAEKKYIGGYNHDIVKTVYSGLNKKQNQRQTGISEILSSQLSKQK